MITIYSEMFKTRKDIHDLKLKLKELNELSKNKETTEILCQIEDITEQIQHLKIRITVLERLTEKFKL